MMYIVQGLEISAALFLTQSKENDKTDEKQKEVDASSHVERYFPAKQRANDCVDIGVRQAGWSSSLAR